MQFRPAGRVLMRRLRTVGASSACAAPPSACAAPPAGCGPLRPLRALWVCLVLALLVAAPAGCGSGESVAGTGPSGSSSPRRGGTYDFPLQGLPAAVAPWAPPEQGTQIGHQVFEGLVTYHERGDGTLEVLPCLAESWSANDDATVWTFRLRRGVTFQPPVNREVTARDIVAGCRYATAAVNRCWYSYGLNSIVGTDGDGIAADPDRLGVKALGRYVVRYTLKEPFADFPGTLGGVWSWVWPVDYLRRVGRARFGQQPVGTGPFTLSRLVRGQYADLAANPAWWDAASGRPYLDAVHFRAFPSVSSALYAFQRGLVDYTWVPQGQVAVSRSLPQVRSGEWTARTVPLLCMGYIAFHLGNPLMRGEKGRDLRRAIDLACDRRKMIAAATDGVFLLPTGYPPSTLPGWAESTFPLAHDTARAAELWRRAGSPPLTIIVTEDPLARIAAATLRDDLAEVGIDLTVERVSWDEYVRLYTRQDLWAIYSTGWIADYPSADNFLFDLFHSRMATSAVGTAYSNRRVDRLLEEARSTADEARHLELNREAARLIAADLPMLPLFQFAEYRLTSERIGGFNEDPMGWVDMWELWVR